MSRGDVSVEDLEQALDEGKFEEYGAPPATDADGDWLEWHYTLMYGTLKLSAGQHFSWYNIPSGATIHVVKEKLPSKVSRTLWIVSAAEKFS